MGKLMNVENAKIEIRNLQEFVTLVENYEVNSIQSLIIKEYAYAGSIAGLLKNLRDKGYEGEKIIERQVALDVIKSKPKDKLHKLVRTDYMARTKRIRKGI